MKKIFFLIFCLLLLFAISGCNLSEPKANYVGSKVTKVDLQGVETEFYFDIDNPNPLSIEISEFDYNVFINGRELLTEHRPGFAVEANSKKRITIPVFARYDRIFDSLLGATTNFMNGKGELEYKIEGSMQAGTAGLRVPVSLGAQGKIDLSKAY